MKKAIVAGHICLDIYPLFERGIDLVPGRLYEVGTSSFALGGAVPNTGLTMYKLGMDVRLMSKVGADAYGGKVQSLLLEHAPEHGDDLRVDSAVDTSYTYVFAIPGKDRMFFHCPGSNAVFTCADVDFEAVASADLFHYGYPAFMAEMYRNDAAQLVEMYKKAKALGVTTSMDPGMPDPSGEAGKANWTGILEAVLPYVDVFLPSADELLYMVDSSKFGDGDQLSAGELSALGERLVSMGSAVVVIKLGSRGMYVRTGSAERLERMGKGAPADVSAWADRELWFPVYEPTCYCGATGAGDASIGGFLTAMLRGLDLRATGQVAAALGASNVEAPDSLSGIHDWDATLKRMSDGWKKVAFDVNEPGWTCGEDQVWERC